MKILKIHAKNFKGFKRIDLDLRNINLLIGKNGSGKTTVIRLLSVLIDSMAKNDPGVIDCDISGEFLASTFSELSYKGLETSTITLGALLNIEDDRIEFETEIIFSTEQKEIIVKKFSLIKNEKLELNIDSTLNPDTKDEFDVNGKVGKLFFNGILPCRESLMSTFEEDNCTVEKIKTSAIKIKEQMVYLGPFRSQPKRVYSFSIKKEKSLGFDGANAPASLYIESLKTESIYISELQSWMIENFNGKYIYCKNDSLGFSLRVKGHHNDVNLCDEGIGYSQIFPILIGNFFGSDSTICKLQMVEQPELHLHPGVSGVIADLYIDSLRRFTNNLILLETHSKEVVLRFRRRVAEGHQGIKSKDISIIYIDDSSSDKEIKYINIESDGSVDWWPDGVFEESFNEVMAIHEANN